MIDTLLHIALGAAVSLLTWVVFSASGNAVSAFPCAFVGAFTVYFREVTQRQAGRSLSFTLGWLPWKWGTQKIIETIVPVGVLLAAGAVVQWAL